MPTALSPEVPHFFSVRIYVQGPCAELHRPFCVESRRISSSETHDFINFIAPPIQRGILKLYMKGTPYTVSSYESIRVVVYVTGPGG